MIDNLLEGIFNFITSLLPQERKTVYDADFMASGEVLSSWNKGFRFGNQSLPIEDCYKNAMIYGSSGSGKSVGILLPSIFRMCGHCTLVINDPSGELATKSSGAAMRASDVKILNYNTPSEGYNPLSFIMNSSDERKISKMLINHSLGQSKDPFWNQAAEGLTTLAIRYVFRYASPEYRSLYNVYNLLTRMSYDPDTADRLFSRTDEEMIAEYKSLLTYGDKMLSSIVATARTALSMFGTDPTVALVTSYNTIDFDELRRTPTTLYIQTNIKDAKYYSLITSLFLDQCFGHIMSTQTDRDSKPIFFLVDEASSIQYSSLEITLANIRKSKAGILQVYQSPAQLVDRYGVSTARALNENSFCKVYMPNQNIQTAQELELTLGRFEFLDEDNIKRTRSLLTANEIRELQEESLIFVGSNRAIKKKIVPYYEQFNLQQLAGIPPYEPTCKIPYQTPPRLNFDEL